MRRVRFVMWYEVLGVRWCEVLGCGVRLGFCIYIISYIYRLVVQAVLVF